MKQTTTNKSKFLRHSKCNNCGSSDGRAIYEDGSTYCFVCNTFEKQGTEAVDIDDTPSLQATINLADRQRDITLLPIVTSHRRRLTDTELQLLQTKTERLVTTTILTLIVSRLNRLL